ncbi:MAG: carboxypeptidase-like regulatory domain-containing protein, partial [Actinomycetota bacterium]|nr:carboxypeptidase-like regulatory domain-containing protein [Actinomycetota bacterium]
MCGATFATPREVIDHIAIEHPDYQYGLVFGTIKDIVTLQPIAGALVTLDSMSQLTDSNGNLLFVNVPLGSYIARVTKDGYFPWEGEREINEPGDTESVSVRLTPMPGPGPELTILGIEFPTTLQRGSYIDDNTHEYIPVTFTVQINLK